MASSARKKEANPDEYSLKTATNPSNIELEQRKRLKFMGYLLFLFSIIAIIWDYLPFVEDELDEVLIELEELPPPIPSYIISPTFATVGLACLLFSWKRKT